MKQRSEGEEKMVKSHTSFWRRKWMFLDKRNTALILFPHLLSILAPFYFTWNVFWASIVLYILFGLFGISLGYHRLITHKSFKLPKWLEYLFVYCGVFALQGDPIGWTSTHRYHHQFVDTKRDPHSPIEGFWFSHITWIADSYALTKKVDPKYEFQETQINVFKGNMQHGKPSNVGDLEDQMFYRFLQDTYYLHVFMAAVVLYTIGGLPLLTWGLGVTVAFGFHATFMLNSVCHSWGKQPWESQDLSKNNWLVALVTFGEGWHNNHHAFDYSARHGFEWWQVDFSWYVIKFLQAIGLATEVKLPSQRQKLAKKLQKVATN